MRGSFAVALREPNEPKDELFPNGDDSVSFGVELREPKDELFAYGDDPELLLETWDWDDAPLCGPATGRFGSGVSKIQKQNLNTRVSHLQSVQNIQSEDRRPYIYTRHK